jgi:succinate dehydrogenase/fumarate reductase flavoprotein subunit
MGAYSPEMLESIKRLEHTRQERLGQKIPLMPPEEKTRLLEEFHPDYKKGTQRELRVGPSKGQKTPYEIADVFEAYSLVNPEKFKVGEPDYDVDVLVLGGGGAGCAAALLARENGASVLLATKLRIGDANTNMAQGGIQAADKAHDSPAIHYLDVMGGGRFTNDPKLVRALTIDAPGVIKWLEDLGTMFDKEPDGTLVEIHGGGTSRKRMHSARDYSGGEIMKTLRDEFFNRSIPYVEFSPAVELLTSDGICTGAVLYNMETEELLVVRAKTTIIAAGGSGRLHVQGFPTSNHYGATGDGLILAYRAGAPIVFMDTIQYHPTGAAYPEQILGLLVTEKVRGLGAHLVNNEGNRYIYELETRDVNAAGIIRECLGRKRGVTTPSGQPGIWLDSPVIEILQGEGTILKQLPAMYRQYMNFGIDMTKEPILIYPTQHYQNGGVKITENGEAEGVRNLYVAGETAGGIHGRNRLMGNSLLDILVFGRRAGKHAAAQSKTVEPGALTLEHVKRYHKELDEAGIEKKRYSPMLLPDYRRPELRKEVEPIIT